MGNGILLYKINIAHNNESFPHRQQEMFLSTAQTNTRGEPGAYPPGTQGTRRGIPLTGWTTDTLEKHVLDWG